MKDPERHQEFAERLLAQETRVTDAQLLEHRSKLELGLAKAVRQERRMRVVAFGMAAVVLLGFWCLLLASAGPTGVDPLKRLFNLLPDPLGTIIGIALWACYLTCAICVIPFLLLYFLQYRRAVEHIRQEQILAILSGLEREIADLRKQMPRNAD
jgi:hypothetical protein